VLNWTEVSSPYETVLGDDWYGLAPGVQQAHSVPLIASGSLRITHSSRWLPRLLCKLIKLPPEGSAVATTIALTQEGDRVQWVRTFDGMRAVSLQEVTSDGFIEEAGPFRLVMRIVRDGDSVVHQQKGLQLFGAPVPRIFGPSVAGRLRAGSSDASWHLHVTISHPILGLICSYEGEMTAQ
jgi:hypothetical protein